MDKPLEIKMTNGILKFVPLMGGKLLVAQKIKGVFKPNEVMASLRQLGIFNGILNESIPLLERADITQIPVARAYYQDEPPEFKIHFGLPFEQTLIKRVIAGEAIELIKDRLSVKTNEKLVSVKKPFRTVLRFPDGKFIEKSVLKEKYSLNVFAGANVKIKNNQIYSNMEGSVFISKWGRVYVFPILTVRGLGEIHGKLDDQFAVHVTEDIHSYSNLEIPSNVFVTGMIHSSFIKANGYLQAQEGIDNAKRIENSRIIAGKSVIAPHIKRYRIITGEDVLANERIVQSVIISHRNVVARLIEDSEVRVKNQLIAGEIRGSSQIYLGPSFVKNESYKRNIIQNQQDEKRLMQREYFIEEMMDKIENEKNVLLNYFYRLRESGRKQMILDNTMLRLLKTLKESYEVLQNRVADYERLLAGYLNNKILLAYYLRENRTDERPFIRVYGKISKGTMLVVPNQNVKLTKSLENVTIFLDRNSGTMEIVTHRKPEAKEDKLMTSTQ